MKAMVSLVFAGCLFAGATLAAQEISAGMPIDKAVKTLGGIATDLTAGLDITAGRNGKSPKGLCWELKDYDLIVWLYNTDGEKISSLGFWHKKDFNQPKGYRYAMEKTARSITFDPKNHTFKDGDVPPESRVALLQIEVIFEPATQDERQRSALPGQPGGDRCPIRWRRRAT